MFDFSKIDLNDKKTLRNLHLLIILAWLIPYVTPLPQIETPFVVTVAFLVLDIIKSKGYSPYKQMIPHVIWTNLLGMLISTLEYELSNYAFWQDANFGPGMGFLFAGIWDIIYAVLLVVAIIIGFIILFIKNGVRR